jgi:pimeloyl-ACP methyl ester carboxylesterase
VDKTEQIEVGGQRARILDTGGGSPVVVLHGWGGRIESMAPAISCLSATHRVIALDLPGFGESPVPAGVWGTPDYSAFVRDVVKELGVERAHFVGHSYGAKTSLYLAATDERLIDKLVLVGSSGLKSPPSNKVRVRRMASQVARTAGRIGGPGTKLRDAVYRRIQSEDYRDAGDMRPILVRVVNEDLAPFLPRIKAPTLLVWGSEDDAVPLAHARRMEQAIPDAGLVVFEGAGHFAYLDEPDRFCRVVQHFLGPVEDR